MKICKQCSEEKELHEFYLCKGKPQPRCRTCVNEQAKQRYQNNPEVRSTRNEYMRAWQKTKRRANKETDDV